MHSKQTPLQSFIESWGNTIIGFAGSFGIQLGVCWYYGLPLRWFDNLGVIAVFTLWSLARNYGWRRFMERLNFRIPISTAGWAVLAERKRQIDGEGWSAAHDDAHKPGELALAGVCYIVNAVAPRGFDKYGLFAQLWPWDSKWWKPAGFWRDMVRGCALILAEMDRSLRQRGKVATGGVIEPASESLPLVGERPSAFTFSTSFPFGDLSSMPAGQHPLRWFLFDCTKSAPADRTVPAQELYAAYIAYCSRREIKPCSARQFHYLMRACGFELHRGAISRWRGLELTVPAAYARVAKATDPRGQADPAQAKRERGVTRAAAPADRVINKRKRGRVIQKYKPARTP